MGTFLGWEPALYAVSSGLVCHSSAVGAQCEADAAGPTLQGPAPVFPRRLFRQNLQSSACLYPTQVYIGLRRDDSSIAVDCIFIS